jgi:hypothetical protein
LSDRKARAIFNVYILVEVVVMSNDDKIKNFFNTIIDDSKPYLYKINLVQSILDEGYRRMKVIGENEKKKTSQETLLKTQADIIQKKEAILKYMKEHIDYTSEKFKEYLILEKVESEIYGLNGKNDGQIGITIHYILYKDDKLYMGKYERLNIRNQPIEEIKILGNDLDKKFKDLLDILYNKIIKLQSGGKRIATAAPAYKLNGEKVSLLINKKKLNRSVYVKGNGNGKAKYCKINNEFVLLSKLKNKIIE